MSAKVKVKIKRITGKYPDIPLPAYETTHAAGMDIRAALDEDMIISPGRFVIIPTNLSVEIPEGYEIQVRPRSGLAAKHGITVLNTPGTIDSDYRGEVKVIMVNFGENDFKISSGDRIAQLVLAKVYQAEFIETDNLEKSERNENGFGHTGID